MVLRLGLASAFALFVDQRCVLRLFGRGDGGWGDSTVGCELRALKAEILQQQVPHERLRLHRTRPGRLFLKAYLFKERCACPDW